MPSYFGAAIVIARTLRVDFVLLDPAIDALFDERPHFRRPSLDASPGGFAFPQGEGELDALAIEDIEHSRFPEIERGAGGLLWVRFVLGRLFTSRRGRWRDVRCSAGPMLAFLKVSQVVMQDCDARLNAVVLRGCHADGMHSARVFVSIDPASHMLVHQRPYLRRPGFDSRASGFAVVQGDDEFGALAVG